MSKAPDCFIYDCVRTPRGRGKSDGALHEVTALELATQTLAALRDRNSLDTGLVEDVVLGCVDPVGEAGGDIARTAALNADYEQTVPGVQINRFCASGLEATNMAAAQIMSGQAQMTIGGGVETMSRIGIGASGGALPLDPDIALKSYFVPQGISADLIATKYGFSRGDVDAYAVQSQARAKAAWDDGRFAGSVLAITDINGLTLLDRDEHMRPETTMQSLGGLGASFEQMGEFAGFDAVATQRYPEIEKLDHVHHAGNSSGIVDGAAAILLGSAEAGKDAGLAPRARIRAFASIGTEPCIMLTGPVDVSAKVLNRAGMTTSDIDLYEINEAFASVVLHAMSALRLDHDTVNVNGGAIAMGHPLGATGAMLLGTLLDEMERRDVETGLVTLCIGAGMGTATIIERI
ncbi:3-ketoacyl-CoA thiolase @ Acetyl-CoA acetyltransferase [hydrothermal vent metagenome]|uniref:3-ketoacyl-CoA thiolase @ Acetyl-CoA acetyltransferase n=1 Tax=hydrothermal vent metagenome TaxID=652676 RepID=A0A3B0TML1_9ZZZZ